MYMVPGVRSLLSRDRMPHCADLTAGRFGFEACYSCVLVGVLLVVRCWRNAPYMRVRRSSLHTK